MLKTISNKPKRLLLDQNKEISLKYIIPNLITILSFCSGLTSIRFALEHRWEGAVLAIMIASILDGMDGRVARMLNAATRFGEILDSLSDLVCFGVAPAFLVYCFSIGKFIKFGWSGVMFYTTCQALRLARFNALLESEDQQPEWLKKYFMGVPAPAGALLALTPLCFYLGTEIYFFQSLYLNIAVLWIVGALVISRIPTISLKNVKINRSWTPVYFVFFVLCAIILYNHIWLGLGAVGLGYLGTIPYTFNECKKLNDQNR